MRCCGRCGRSTGAGVPRGIPSSGKRAKGAGRPRKYPPDAVRVTVTLAPQDAEFLRGIGDGSASLAVERLLTLADRLGRRDEL